ncbi:hypothetical protein [Streptacidiphilus sp. EB129]|uniref:hypothetical protein n=1 Tax=Streptacidiphilus sp. EB129 TaxID=3156262 RepID=UPI00351573BA
MPVSVHVNSTALELASFTGEDAAPLLKAAGQWLEDKGTAICLVSVNLVPFYLCPDDCEPAEGQPGVRLDLTVDVSGLPRQQN